MPVADGPWAAFNFLVQIDGIGDAGFAEVSGLSLAVDYMSYRTGDDKRSTPRRIPGLVHPGEVTLKRGMMLSLALFQWLRGTTDGGSDDPRNMSVTLLNANREPVRVFRLRGARIIKYVAGPFNATENTIAIEALTLSVDGLDIE